MSLAVGGAAAIVGLSAALVATDPQNRCAMHANVSLLQRGRQWHGGHHVVLPRAIQAADFDSSTTQFATLDASIHMGLSLTASATASPCHVPCHAPCYFASVGPASYLVSCCCLPQTYTDYMSPSGPSSAPTVQAEHADGMMMHYVRVPCLSPTLLSLNLSSS